MQIDFLRTRKYVCAIFVVTPKYHSFLQERFYCTRSVCIFSYLENIAIDTWRTSFQYKKLLFLFQGSSKGSWNYHQKTGLNWLKTGVVMETVI